MVSALVQEGNSLSYRWAGRLYSRALEPPLRQPPYDSIEVERRFGNTPSHRTLLTIFAVFQGSEKNLSPSAREETNRMVLVASLILVA